MEYLWKVIILDHKTKLENFSKDYFYTDHILLLQQDHLVSVMGKKKDISPIQLLIFSLYINKDIWNILYLKLAIFNN